MDIDCMGDSDARLVCALAWSPDGSKLAASISDVDSVSCFVNPKVLLLDASTNQILHTFQTSTVPTYGLAWHPNGLELATADDNGTVYRWSTITGQLLHTYSISSSLNIISWSPDGTKLASGGWDNTIRIIDIATGQITSSINLGTPNAPGIDTPVWLGWSPDGSKLAATGNDGSLRVWNTTTFTSPVVYTGQSSRLYAGQWSHDGSKIAVSDINSAVTIWDMTSGQATLTFQGQNNFIGSVKWNRDDSQLAFTDDDAVRIWSAITGQPLTTLQADITLTYVDTMDWSIDGKLVYGGLAYLRDNPSPDGISMCIRIIPPRSLFTSGLTN